MKALAVISVALLWAAAGMAQNRGGFVNPQPFVQGTFGNAVFPGGTSAMPGVTRTFGNAAFPSGAGFPRLVVPGAVTDPTFLMRRGAAGTGFGRGDGRFGNRRNNGVLVPYAVPVYVGGFYDNPYLPDGPAPGPAPQQQPNVVVVYPQVVPQPTAYLPPNDSYAQASPDQSTQPASAEAAAPEPEHYLIAFKDHTIYAALAFYVQGDTLHYFTAGNTHNQVSLSMIDKPLTERLNRESGVDMRLP